MTSSCWSGWPISIRSGRKQAGVRHFHVERRLLALAPGLAEAIRARKLAGEKTEPAFARLLGLPGDPYQALLALEPAPEAELAALARRALTRLT